MEEQLPTWLESFQQNPLPHLEAFVLGLLALGLAIAAHLSKNVTAQPKLGLGLGAIVGALLALACGVFGYLSATTTWKETIAVAGLSPADVARLQRAGEQEASWNLVSGAVAAALPFALGLLAVFVSRARKATTERVATPRIGASTDRAS
jgi:TRAP-type C4-dicarboxylate transport system permease small subunit